MAMHGPSLRSQSGSTLLVVTIITIAMLITTLAALQLAGLDAVLVRRDHHNTQAFYLAEGGTERGRAWLEAQACTPGGTEIIYPFGEEPDSLAGGVYLVSIEPDPLNGIEHPSIYTVASVATVGRCTRRIEVDLATQSFADFVYFTDKEHMQGHGGPIWFVTPDLTDGALHTNDQIHILGDPTFAGFVTSAYGGPDDNNPNHDAAFEYYNGNPHSHLESAAPSNPPYDIPTFEDGYGLGAAGIPLPRDAVADFKNMAQHGGVYITGSQEVAFSRTGSSGQPMYGYVSYRQNHRRPWTDVRIAGTNGVMYISGQVKLLGGALDGQLTIVTNTAIVIQDDIVYRASDEYGPLPGCDDVLGLICTGDITVANNAANRDDCVIHAHMIATNTSFKVAQWANGGPRGVLSVYGGICQKFRGPVGTGYLRGDRVIVNTGYSKDYHYDHRLAYMPPPGYELYLQTGRYRFLEWRDVDAE